MGLFDDQQRERGYATERRLDESRPERARPRLGGSALLPASGAALDLFSVAVEDLASEERAAAGWCVRFGVPDPVPSDAQYDVHELLAEITIVAGGVAHVIEANVFPGATLHLVGEQIAARLKWGIAPVTVPAAALLRWQLSRGTCQTKAVRAFTAQAPLVGLVPTFATGFALFSGSANITEDIQLDFATHTGATRVIQHFAKTDLLQVIAAFSPVPPGASAWRWLTATAAPVRLAFNLGGQQW